MRRVTSIEDFKLNSTNTKSLFKAKSSSSLPKHEKIFYTIKVNQNELRAKNAKIEKVFDSVDEYLKTNESIIVGNKKKGPRWNSNQNIIQYSFVGPKALYEENFSKRVDISDGTKIGALKDAQKRISILTSLQQHSNEEPSSPGKYTRKSKLQFIADFLDQNKSYTPTKKDSSTSPKKFEESPTTKELNSLLSNAAQSTTIRRKSVNSNSTNISQRDKEGGTFNLPRIDHAITNWTAFNKIHYEYIPTPKLNDIYTKFKELKSHNRTKSNEFIDCFPKEIQNSIMDQERKLCLKEYEDSKTTRISKNLCKVTNKKKEELLIYKSDSFRIKKEITNLLDQTQHEKHTELTANKWISVLRRPENFEGKRKYIFNSGTDDRPNWAYGIEVFPKYNEYIRNQNSIFKYNNPEKFIPSKTMRDSFHSIDTSTRANFSNISDLRLVGNDLLNNEIENASKLRGRKLILKKNLNNSEEMISDEILSGSIIAKDLYKMETSKVIS